MPVYGEDQKKMGAWNGFPPVSVGSVGCSFPATDAVIRFFCSWRLLDLSLR